MHFIDCFERLARVINPLNPTHIYRACPECRVPSDFVVPSKYWFEDDDDKEKLIRDYKNVLRYVFDGRKNRKADKPFEY